MKTLGRLLVLGLAGALLAAVAAGPACHEPDCGCEDHAGNAAHTRKTEGLPPPGPTYEVLGYRDGLRHFVVKYNERLYRGGEVLDDRGARALRAWGVRTVVTVTPDEKERTLAERHGLELVELPFTRDSGCGPEVLDPFLKAVEASDGPVYVHCIGGTHRAGALCAYYRMKVEGWTFERAIEEYDRLGGDRVADHALITAIRPKP